MDKFYALSTPIRRDIIALLAEYGQLPATEIAQKFKVSSSAVSQHLKVLLQSDLVKMHKQAQQRIYQLDPSAILELEAWANQLATQLDQTNRQYKK